MDLFDREKMVTIKGRGVGDGRCVGYLRYRSEIFKSAPSGAPIGSPDGELVRFETARAEAKTEIAALEDEIYTVSGSEGAHIFDTQLLLIDDGIFTYIPRMYIGEGCSAEEAVLLAKNYFFDSLCKPEEREQLLALSSDVCDVARRICDLLRSSVNISPGDADEPYILVAEMPLPSEIALRRGELLGIVARSGFETSSAALVARALEIPSLSVAEDIFCEQARRYAVLDAASGELCINPDIEALERFGELSKKSAEEERFETDLLGRESVTRGGERIELFVNMSSDSDVPLTICEGVVGLQNIQSEASSVALPDEDALFEEYRALCEQFIGKTLIIRSCSRADLVSLSDMGKGGDVGALYVVRNDTLRAQMSAVMRAAVYGPICFAVRVSDDIDDVRRLKLLQRELCAELLDNGHEYVGVKIGAVIDSAGGAIACDKIFEVSDFICVDAQKIDATLFGGVDNVGCGIARRRLLKYIKECAEGKGKRALLSLASECGEDAVREALGLGYTSLSVAPDKLTTVKQAICNG